MVLIGLWAGIVTLLVFFLSLLTWGHTWSAWLYARMLGGLGLPLLGVKIEVLGRENLPVEPSILLVNHQSNLDAYILSPVFPRGTVVIAKREMLKVPLFGLILLASRNIFVNREDAASGKKVIKDAIVAIQKDKNNIWIFPEGTRSHGKGLGEFKKGAFVMAIAAQAPIIPIVNQPMGHLIDTRQRKARGGKHYIRILPAIPTAGLKFRDADALTARVEALFHKEIQNFPE